MGNNSSQPFRVQVFSVSLCTWKKNQTNSMVAQICHPEDKYIAVFWIQPTTETQALAFCSPYPESMNTSLIMLLH